MDLNKFTFKKFDLCDRSTFSYWYYHWKAFNLTAIKYHVWKFRYLFHDIEKPWLMLFWKDYSKVQTWHRTHNNHHAEYALRRHNIYSLDYEAMVIDNECSRLTKMQSPYSAVQWLELRINKYKNYSDLSNTFVLYNIYKKALETAKTIGL